MKNNPQNIWKYGIFFLPLHHQNKTIGDLNMKQENVKYVLDTLTKTLSTLFDFSVARDIAEAVLLDVVIDIEETADENFNDSDINIALGRVLLKGNYHG